MLWVKWPYVYGDDCGTEEVCVCCDRTVAEEFGTVTFLDVSDLDDLSFNVGLLTTATGTLFTWNWK